MPESATSPITHLIPMRLSLWQRIMFLLGFIVEYDLGPAEDEEEEFNKYEQPFTAPHWQFLFQDITLMPGLVASLMPAAVTLCVARYRDGITNERVVDTAVELAIGAIGAGNTAAENFLKAMQGDYINPNVIERREQMATIGVDLGHDDHDDRDSDNLDAVVNEDQDA